MFDRAIFFQTVLTGAGVLSAFFLVFLCAFLGWPLNYIGVCFVVVGFGLLLPVAATLGWKTLLAEVSRIDKRGWKDIIEYRYRFNEQEFFGTANATTEADPEKPGYKISILVNPKHPEQSFSHFGVHVFLGFLFPVVGFVTLLSDAVYFGSDLKSHHSFHFPSEQSTRPNYSS